MSTTSSKSSGKGSSGRRIRPGAMAGSRALKQISSRFLQMVTLTQLLRSEDVREWLQIGQSTLEALEKSGDLIPIRIKSCVRYLVSDVKKYLAKLINNRPKATNC